MLSQRAMNIEKLVKQSMVTKKVKQIHDFLAIQCSIHFTAYHNVYLCINSNFFPHYLICTWVIGYVFVHTMFKYLFNELWPSCIYTVLPKRCPQMISNAQQKDEEYVICTIIPGILQVDKTFLQQNYCGKLDETIHIHHSIKTIIKLHK